MFLPCRDLPVFFRLASSFFQRASLQNLSFLFVIPECFSFPFWPSSYLPFQRPYNNWPSCTFFPSTDSNRFPSARPRPPWQMGKAPGGRGAQQHERSPCGCGCPNRFGDPILWLVGEFTTHFRLPILVVGLGCSLDFGTGFFDPWPCVSGMQIKGSFFGQFG